MNTTVKNLFQQFCKVYDLKTSAKHIDHVPANDFVFMDYVPHYGGYRISIKHTNTSESDFSGSARMSAKEMTAYLRGLLAAKNKYNFEGITN